MSKSTLPLPGSIASIALPEKHYKETTILMVAQRVSSLMGLTHILVLEDGRAIGYGNHEELLRQAPANFL